MDELREVAMKLKSLSARSKGGPQLSQRNTENRKDRTAGLSFLNLDTAEQLIMRFILFALLCSLAGLASAQFQFFEQMFNQGGQQQQQQQQQQQAQNVASDSEWYQRTYESGIFHPLY